MNEGRLNRYPRQPRVNGPWDGYGWNAPPDEISTGQLWDDEIGRNIGGEAYERKQVQQARLNQQSDEIVARMERCGLKGTTGRQMAAVGLVTGAWEEQADYRNSNMIPSVQSRNTHEMMTHVRYLFDCVPQRELRMLVISGGWISIPAYRKEHKAHCRRISRMAADPAVKAAGVEVVFYNVENTIKRTDDGVAMLNLHSHVLIRCRRHLGKSGWAKLMDVFRKASPKGYVHDSAIRKPAEVVKYSFKPSEFDRLTDDDFVELFHQIGGGRQKIDPDTGKPVMRDAVMVPVSEDPDELTLWRDPEPVPVMEGPLRFFHPLGEMRRFRAKLRENGQKLLLVPTSDDRMIWRLSQRREREPREDSRNPAMGNKVVAITRPMARFSERKEPCVMVEDYTGNFDLMVRLNALQDLVARSRATHADRVRADQKAVRELPTGPGGDVLDGGALYAAHNSDNCPGGAVEGWAGTVPPGLPPPSPVAPEVAH